MFFCGIVSQNADFELYYVFLSYGDEEQPKRRLEKTEKGGRHGTNPVLRFPACGVRPGHCGASGSAEDNQKEKIYVAGTEDQA